MKTKYDFGTRLLALALCLIMVLGLVPGGAVHTYAAEEETEPTTATEPTVEAETEPTEEATEPTGTPADPIEGWGTVEALTDNFLCVDNNDHSTTIKKKLGVSVKLAAERRTESGKTEPEDGWWVSFKVTAPKGATLEQLKKAKIKFPSTDSFQKATFSEDKTITIWKNIQDLRDKNEHEWEYQIAWNGDETSTQKITLKLKNSGSLYEFNKTELSGVVKFDQEEYDWDFDNFGKDGRQCEYPKVDILPGYSNIAVKYTCESSINGVYKDFVDSPEGKVTVTNSGPLTLTAEVTDYYLCKVSCTINVNKCRFEEYEITVGYKDNLTVSNALANNFGWCTKKRLGGNEKEEVTYTILGENSSNVAVLENPSNPKVSIIGAGTVTVQATRSYQKGKTSPKYEETAYYTLTVNKGNTEQAPLKFEPNAVEWYQDEVYAIPQAVGGSGDGRINYTISDPSMVKDENGKITPLHAGDTFEIRAKKEGDNTHKESNEAVLTVTVLEPKQPGTFGFPGGNTVNKTYEPGLTIDDKKASGGDLEGEITYSIMNSMVLDADGKTYVQAPEGKTVAEVDAKSGIVTVKIAGRVTVLATKSVPGYTDATAKYTLTIDKADRMFEFEKPLVELGLNDLVNGKYGPNKIINANWTMSDQDQWEYSIEEDSAKIDNTGTITFEDVCDITVKAAVSADDCYNYCEKTYILYLRHSFPEAPFDIIGRDGQKYESDEWITDSKVTIKLKDEYKADYRLCFEKQGTYVEQLEYSKQGSNEVYVYIMAYSSSMPATHEYQLKLKLDSYAPKLDGTITYDSAFAKAWKEIFFGAKTFNVYFDLTDGAVGSGIALVEYTVNGEDYKAVTDYTEDNDIRHYQLETWDGKTTFFVRVTDTAGNSVVVNEKGQTVVVNDQAPVLSANSGDKVVPDDGNTLYIAGTDAKINLAVADKNFSLYLDNGGAPVVTVDGQPVELTWSEDGTAVLNLTGEGSYSVEMMFNNQIVDEQTLSFTVVLDSTKPGIDPSFDNQDAFVEVDNKYYYQNGQTVTVTVKDANLDAHAPAEIRLGDQVLDNLTWIAIEGGYECELEYPDDGEYVLTVDSTDLAGNQAETKTVNFVVDSEDPTVESDYNKDWSLVTILESIFFNKNSDPEISVAAEDATSGIRYFLIECGGKTLTLDNEGNVVSSGAENAQNEMFAFMDRVSVRNNALTFRVKQEFDGKLNFGVQDFAGRTVWEGEKHAIVDNTAPKVTISYGMDRYKQKQGDRLVFNGEIPVTVTVDEANFYPDDVHITIYKENNPTEIAGQWNDKTYQVKLTADGEYRFAINNYQDKSEHDMSYTVEYPNSDVIGVSDIVQRIYSSGTMIIDKTAPKIEVKWTSGVNGNNFYKDPRTAEITVTERNFDENRVNLVLGTEIGDVPNLNWENVGGDIWKATVTFTSTGHYDMKLTCTDLARNAADYTQSFEIDNTAPAISVVYTNKNVKKTTSDGRQYFAAEQQATITITERNFDEKEAKLVIDSTDVEGKKLGVNVVQSAWEKTNSGVYVKTLTFRDNANYTLAVNCTDKAGNAAAYGPDKFTVDTQKPKLSINYGGGVADSVLNAILFRGQTKVTITAEDPISGVDRFSYEYVSDLTGQKVSGDISADEIGKASVTRTFYVPKNAGEQFNGRVNANVYDRSGNTENLEGKDKLIVDSIAPNATVTYNQAVQELAGVTYYAGEIVGTIHITEANFVSGDVTVTVTKDGVPVNAAVRWSDNSRDSHTGAFTLAEDGDYTVSVNYTDRSGNAMAAYTSGKMTVDTKKPTVKVTNIKPNTANKDKVYGFTIEVSDNNLDRAAMKPSLKAVAMNENGLYTTKEIDLGQPVARDGGTTYIYTVENLTEDAMYTLTTVAQDLSGNTENLMLLDDGKTYDKVQFSINRAGSAYAYGDDATGELADNYYNYSVDQDVVLVEVNVDPIEDYAVTLNGEALKEGTDYTTQQTSNPGEWSKRTYTIRKELFAQEGAYSLIVSSTDKTKTTAYSDVKSLSAAFVVDQTAPVLSVTGLESGGRYQTDAQVVTVIPTDEGGRLRSLRVEALDANGNPLKDDSGKNISVRFDMSGEELLKHLEENDGKLTFTVPECYNGQVRIVCNDCAVNAEGATNASTLTFERITVSQSQMVIFYANKPLFIGTIAALLALILILVVLIKRKQDEKKKQAKKSKV